MRLHGSPLLIFSIVAASAFVLPDNWQQQHNQHPLVVSRVIDDIDFAMYPEDTSSPAELAANGEFNDEIWDDEGLVRRFAYPSRPKIIYSLPLGSISDPSRCPSGLMACPIEPMTFLESLDDFEADFECIDPAEDPSSCGGCLTLGAGKDCNNVPGVASSACSWGSCIALSCDAGYELDHFGARCVQAIPLKHEPMEQ